MNKQTNIGLLLLALLLLPLQVYAEGKYNTLHGSQALAGNTTGFSNTATGFQALKSNTEGRYNTATGQGALLSNINGFSNTATGYQSLSSNTAGRYNTATGQGSLLRNDTGFSNTATGYQALNSNTEGRYNTAMGQGALSSNISGFSNTAIGYLALRSNAEGRYNTAMGQGALSSNTSGFSNTAMGYDAGSSNVDGWRNIFLGFNAGRNELGSDKLYIASNAETPLLYGVFSPAAAGNKLGIGTNVLGAADTITVWNGAHLTAAGVWTNASSRSLKEHIRQLDVIDAEQALDQLKPVRYHYKSSPAEEYVGFIAEDVPELVAMQDRKSLSSMDVVAVLTRVVQSQKARLASQAKAIADQQGEIVALRSERVRDVAALRSENGRLAEQQAALASRVEMLTRAMAGSHMALLDKPQ